MSMFMYERETIHNIEDLSPLSSLPANHPYIRYVFMETFLCAGDKHSHCYSTNSELDN